MCLDSRGASYLPSGDNQYHVTPLIGVEGASSTSDMLEHNTSLEDLHLCDDSFGKEDIHQLINMQPQTQPHIEKTVAASEV